MTSAPSAEEKGYLAGTATADAGEKSTLEVDANTPAVSSNADDKTTPDAKAPTSMLEAVQKAAAKTDKPVEPPSGTEGEDSKTVTDEAAAGAKADADKAPEDKDAEPPFHKHPRWQAMKAERDEFKASHDQFVQLQGFMQNANLDSEEVNNGFQIMALMKNDPQAALNALLPYVTNLQTVLGKNLPDDLKAKVEDGFIDEATATELAQSRSRETIQKGQAEAAATQAQANLGREIVGAVSAWETEWQKVDADYAAKQPRVQEKIELEIRRNGMPANKTAAVALAKRCKDSVEAELIPFRQKLKPIVPVTGGTAPKSAIEPKSILDIVNQGGRAA